MRPGPRVLVGGGGADLRVGRWGARFRGRAIPCAVGRGGIGVKRAEGDGITPAGRHRIEEIHARLDRRVAPAGARAIGPFDAWSDDPRDPGYNRLVRRPCGFSHERMHRADRLYDLVAVLDWNRAPVEPGRGSAIFLHAWRKPRHPTAGCVAFAPRDLAWILARWSKRSRVIIEG